MSNLSTYAWIAARDRWEPPPEWTAEDRAEHIASRERHARAIDEADRLMAAREKETRDED